MRTLSAQGPSERLTGQPRPRDVTRQQNFPDVFPSHVGCAATASSSGKDDHRIEVTFVTPNQPVHLSEDTS